MLYSAAPPPRPPKLNVAAPPVSQAFGHVGSSRLVPRGAHSSPITIQQKHDQRTARVTGRFESKYLKAKADLKANIRKQLSDLKAKIVECQCGSSLVHGETRSRKRGVIRITFKVGKEHFLYSEPPRPKRQKTNSEAGPLKKGKNTVSPVMNKHISPVPVYR